MNAFLISTRKVMEMLLSNESILMKIYENLFPPGIKPKNESLPQYGTLFAQKKKNPFDSNKFK